MEFRIFKRGPGRIVTLGQSTRRDGLPVDVLPGAPIVSRLGEGQTRLSLLHLDSGT